MRGAWRIWILASALALVGAAPGAETGRLLGFDPAGAAAQLEREARFDELLEADLLREWMKSLSAHPHHPGSPWGKRNAEYLAGLFRSWGFETEIETFEILFPTPRTRLLELLEPTPFRARLFEPPLAEDSTSDQQSEQLPSYNAYSIDGDVTGELVYVNYGRQEDYEKLDRLGIDLRGKIALARYGGSWRGIKPKIAAERGAIGCILYSDPRDDGYFHGDVYPEGAFKNEHGAQRGSVADMPLYPGDPLTPGVGAVPGVDRLPREEAPTLTRIPVLPISYADARPLLEALRGPVAPEGWRGALPLTYHLGPGPAKVRLKLEFDWNLVPAYDVIARISGSVDPDQWILRGNHHDAWVNGAEDPVAGMVALLAEARALGRLVRDGWRPRRTIVYAAWDAEEPGLLGSTEWAEQHAEQLREHLAVYVNTDGNGRGFLAAGGSHTLERFLNEVARDVIDPQKGIPVRERERARQRVHGDEDAQREALEREDLRLSALGSGSDYTPFLQHLGIASLNLSYRGESAGGSYHTIYDSFDHYVRFGDPGFAYGLTLARTAGRVTMRLAEARVLPFDFSGFADTVGLYVDQVAELLDTMSKDTERENRRIADRVYEAVADPQLPYVVPASRDPVPQLDFAPLRNAMERVRQAAAAYEAARVALEATLDRLPDDEAARLSAVLFRSERRLTREQGLPGRPWFRHQIYAPGFYTGYGVKTLPGVREAIEQRDWEQAREQIRICARTLTGFAGEIDRATGLLAGGTAR